MKKFLSITLSIIIFSLIIIAAFSKTSFSKPFVNKKELTLAIIKPDAVKKQLIGKIIAKFEEANLKVVGLKMTKLSLDKAKAFYSVHKNRPFFKELTSFMSSGPVVAIVLEGENAILQNRKIMGQTDPKKAKPGTIRALFGTTITQNAIHGSDGPSTAKQEIQFFFDKDEIYSNHPYF